MEKRITHAELSRIAELSKLSEEDIKAASLVQDLENMLDFAEKISSADSLFLQEETTCLFSLSDLREDIISTPLSKEKVISGAPTHTDSYITVPTVIEE